MQRPYLKVMRAFIKHHWVYPLNNLAVNLTAKKASWWRNGLIRALVIASQLGRLGMTMLRINVMRLKGADWAITYIGEWFSVEELRHVLFPSPANVDYLERVFLWQVPALVRQFINDGEFVICELNRLIPWRPQARYVFTATPWVRQVLDISRPIDDILAGMNQNRRRDIRKMKKTGFTCEYTHDPAKFDFFYHKVYRPYITKRHGDRAIIEEYSEKRREFERGGLILVSHEGQLATGELYRVLGDTCRLGSIGVYGEDLRLVNRGAIVALYWFMLDWARRQGLHALDFGGSRARLNDGVFNFKRQWGTCLQANPVTHIAWTFTAETVSPDLCRFLNSEGFLGLLDGEWRVAMFETPEVHLEKDEIERTRRIAQKAGAAGLVILSHNKKLPVVEHAVQSA